MDLFLLFIFILSIFILLGRFTDFKEEKKKENKYRNSFNSYSYDFNEYDDFDKSKEDKRKSNKIIDLLIKDFNANPYSDKINVVSSDLIYYNFENGYKLKLIMDYIMLTDRNGNNIGLYKLNQNQYNRILNIFLDIAKKSTKRHVNSNYRTYGEYDWDRKYNEYKKENKQQSQNTQSQKTQSPGNPKLDKLNEKIKLRQEQLDKLPRNHKDRDSLQNELDAYKKAVERIKSKN